MHLETATGQCGVPGAVLQSPPSLISVGLFESFGILLGFVQNMKSMQTLSFVLFKFWFQNKDYFGFVQNLGFKISFFLLS